MTVKPGFAGLLALLFLTVARAGQASDVPIQGLKEGQVFPRLVLPSLAGGEPLSILDFRGSKTVLHVFASW